MKYTRSIFLVALFAAAFALVESTVVIYLRQILYPEGFSFPLKLSTLSEAAVEAVREFATLIMLVVVGMLAGKTTWQRYSYFMIAFGVWDIFYYVWLKVIINWPASMLDWDILFLIPIPWIGPVLAPILVSLTMIAGGWLILHLEEKHGVFRASRTAMTLALLGSAAILISFVLDTDAALRFRYPRPYHYELLVLGVVCYVGAFAATARTSGALKSISTAGEERRG